MFNSGKKGQLEAHRQPSVCNCWTGTAVNGNSLYIFGGMFSKDFHLLIHFRTGYNGKKTNNPFLSDLFVLNLGMFSIL